MAPGHSEPHSAHLHVTPTGFVRHFGSPNPGDYRLQSRKSSREEESKRVFFFMNWVFFQERRVRDPFSLLQP